MAAQMRAELATKADLREFATKEEMATGFAENLPILIGAETR